MSALHNDQLRKTLLYCGILASILYIAVDIIAVIQWEGYSYSDQTVSELFAIDAPTRRFVIPFFIMYSLLMIALGTGVWKSAGEKNALKAAGFFIAAKEVEGIIGTLFTPIHLRGVEGTMTDTMHGILTMIGVLFMMTGIWFASRALDKNFRTYSVITIVLMVIGGSLSGMYVSNMSANLPTPGMGILERVNIYAYMLWIVVFVTRLRVNNTQNERIKAPVQTTGRG